MKRRFLKSAAVSLMVLMLAVQVRVPGFAAEIAFDDVAIDSPWYEGICYAAGRGIMLGTGNRTFSADDPVTARQWAVMLCRAGGNYEAPHDTETPFGAACLEKAYRNGWVSLEAIVDPDSGYCRAAIYESVFAALNVPVYESDCPGGTDPPGRNERYMRAAVKFGLCGEGADPFETITRGEAAFILSVMLAGRFGIAEPQKVREFPIRNCAGADMHAFMRELRRVPPNLLRRFEDKNWTYSVDFEYLENLSDRYDMTCVGATSYGAKRIYVSKAYATLHEFGHFLHGELGFPSRVKDLYQTESARTTSFLRDYARKDHYEYFAEYFVYWLENHDKPEMAARLERLTPQTHHFFSEIAENNWSVLLP